MRKMITLALIVIGTIMTLPVPGYGQRVVPVPNPGSGPLVRQRFVAVTHMRDYLQRDHTLFDHWRTRTLLFGVNGTEQIANVGVYVLGQGQVLFSVFRTIQPAHESFLLPGPFYFGQPFQNLADGEAPANVGETIVVVSNRPVIVTGAVLRGTVNSVHVEELFGIAHTQSARTLDVRQFDCTVPEEFAKVAAFCRNLSPVDNN